MMGHLVKVHPKVNLLKGLARRLVDVGDLSKTLVLFPHRRAITYARYYMGKESKGPLLLPEMYAFEDWVYRMYVELFPDPLPVASQWDQCWIAFEAAKEVLSEKRIVSSWEGFSSWALRLVELFREMDEELVDPKNIEYPYDSLPERAIRLLERLGDIYEVFSHKLSRHNLTTYPKVLRWLAEEGCIEERLEVWDRMHVVGFFALTRAESSLFRQLSEKEAVFWWHVDPEKIPGLYRRWFDQGIVSPDKVEVLLPEDPSETEVELFEAHSLHSEIEEMVRRLSGEFFDEPDKRAVVLLDPGALIPVVMHLPEDTPVNVSMGYPFKYTGIFSFFRVIADVVLTRDPDRGYRAEALIELARNPYVGDVNSERELILYGAPFVGRGDMESLPSVRGIVERFVDHFLPRMTPEGFVSAMENVMDQLLSQDRLKGMEKGFVVRLLESLVDLKDSVFAKKEFDIRSLFSLFETVVSRITLAFEGEPLKGLQVLGILETRLLSFEEVFLLDMNEDVVPGGEEVNPLAPQSVRKVLGLPDRERREAIVEYHINRLIEASNKAHLFWQKKVIVDKKGRETKKLRSRYVERIIWEKEKKAGRLLEDRLVRRSLLVLKGKILTERGLLRKSKDQVEPLLKGSISPSMLDEYLRCPLAFYYRRVLGLEPSEEVVEIDLSSVGSAMHQALSEYFAQFKRRWVNRDEVSWEDLYRAFVKILDSSGLRISGPKRFLLLETARYRIEKFVENQPERFRVLAVESTVRGDLMVDGFGRVALGGRVDRVDERIEDDFSFKVVLDYKTGRYDNLKWSSRFLDLANLPWESGRGWLDEVKKCFPSVQLPFYAFLLRREDDTPVLCAYVRLRGKANEAFFPDNRDSVEDYDAWLCHHLPVILSGIIRHMLEADFWYPASDGRICAFCDYKGICRYAV